MTRHRVTLLLSLAVVSFHSGRALGQSECHEWCSGAYTAINGSVSSLTVWDPDGVGPSPELLIAGGIFSAAGGTPCANIAAWDGEHWQPLGAGVSGATSPYSSTAVYALGSFQGDLVAGGTFDHAGGSPARGVARWDGSGWHPLDAGVDGLVTSIAVYGNTLLVGGQFSSAGGSPAANLAGWDGSTWHAVASSMWGHNNQSVVNAIVPGSNGFFVAGYFTAIDGTPLNNIAEWNGAAWLPLGSGIGSAGEVVYALAMHSGRLVTGGYFSVAGGIACGSVAEWDGAGWQSIGTGVGARTNISGTIFPGAVQTLVLSGDDLYAGANFSHMDGVLCNGIARWNDTAWTPLESGFPGRPEVGVGGTVAALAVFRDQVVAGGSLQSAAGRESVGIARWGTCTNCCDGVDFNRDGLHPDTADVDDFLSVFSGGLCSTGTCGDTDFDNDGLFPDTLDIDSLLSVFSGGQCL